MSGLSGFDIKSLGKFLSITTLALSIAACGGGSGGSSNPQPTPVSSISSSSTVATSSQSSVTISSEASSSSIVSSSSLSSSTVVSDSSSSSSSIGNTGGGNVSSTSSQPASSSAAPINTSSSSQQSSSVANSSESSETSSETTTSSSSSISSSSISSVSSSSSVSSASSTSSSSSQPTAPVVDAGVLSSVVAGATVTFSASATAANGQTIVSYLWEQVEIAGVSIVINDEDQLNASFVAPYVSIATTLKFRLTVTDDLDQSSTDTVTVTINPDPNAPSVQITFPPPEGIYNPTDNGNKLSIFGRVTTQGGATVSKITIKEGATEVNATVNGQQWRANNLTIPADTPEITLTVEAEDNQGRISRENLRLSVSNDYGPTSLNESGAILWDETLNKLWVLRTGTFTSDTRIVPVDPRTGARGNSILSTPLAARKMIFNADKSEFLISGAISNQPGKIHSVNKSNGAVTVLSGAEQGTGPDLRTGSAGLALDGNNLYVAENIVNDFSGLMKVNLSTGDREILLEAEDNTSLTYALADIAYHNNEVIMVKNSFSNSRVYGYNLTTKGDRLINNTNSSLDYRSRILMSNGNVLGISDSSLLMRINSTTGAVSSISNKLRLIGGSNYRLFTYDESNRLFYTITRRETISVIDEESGHVVDLAQ